MSAHKHGHPMHSYLVHLANDLGQGHDIIVQTCCPHGMQEWVDTRSWPISNPKVIGIDAKAAAHIPPLHRASEN
ncbi:hypothetical protein [Mycobacterium avium]|uniref:hypothetical protein n=1 Tax=Mycobacterium avium TaxID=1764 RepID=UPI001CC6D755|nr:hypothetical protein [Mycobacterium avium]MBZ4581106.1 hypothetical protein [Mycobacterium avium subsp. hominissuis]MBZ4609029.1 hypothetical protein [Mycobacterium avium subsp. hominissuis]